jgi:hypothetical protein
MANTYGKVSGTFQEIENAYGKVSGTWQEADEIYAKASGTWELVFAAFTPGAIQTLSSGSGTFAVPQGANAIHIQAAVGGGGGAAGGVSYDKAGGESAGAGGGSGAYISDKVFTVVQGETISYSIGSGGAGGNQTANFGQPKIASAGTNTTLSGSTTGSLFTLGAGGGSSGTGGGVQGPLRTNTAGTAGSATILGTVVTSGNFRDSDGTTKSVTTLTGGPVGTFNQSGNGAVGDLTGSGNCSGDNCQIGGFDGGDSYAGNISGGAGSPVGGSTGGLDGTRGSGGGGGGAQYGSEPTTGHGGDGGNGEIRYRFLRVN